MDRPDNTQRMCYRLIDKMVNIDHSLTAEEGESIRKHMHEVEGWPEDDGGLSNP